MVALNNNRTVFIAFLYLLNLRNLIDVGMKLKESVLKNNNQINCTVTIRTRIYQRMDRNAAKYRIGINCGVPRLLDVVLQNVWMLYCINKDKGDESLPLLAFERDVVSAISLKNLKGARSLSSHVGIRNVLSNVCDDDNTKHFQVPSEVPSEKQGRCKVYKENPQDAGRKM